MFAALAKALGQIGEKRLRKVLWKSMFGALLAFVLLWYGVSEFFTSILWLELPYIGWIFEYITEVPFLDGLMTFLSFLLFGFGILILTFMLFAPVMTAVMGLFLDEVCDAVEEKHYPHLGKPRDTGVLESTTSALKFVGIVILVNLAALPIYGFTWWFGLGFVLYYLINGYLIGREYFEQVAHRRMRPQAARELRKSQSGSVMFFGVLVAFGMTIPFVNLVIPVLATTTMVHMFMKMRGKNTIVVDRETTSIVTN